MSMFPALTGKHDLPITYSEDLVAIPIQPRVLLKLPIPHSTHLYVCLVGIFMPHRQDKEINRMNLNMSKREFVEKLRDLTRERGILGNVAHGELPVAFWFFKVDGEEDDVTNGDECINVGAKWRLEDW
ncbi:predicted protein [Pyrenophora tritici-repentis Pt-1C-BFP]|uniref:Uncharacterized protein n=1 Tax=Pyrenophora tritici-repentis (strain Pt-1C-BFP) TaxID=426418 RepID=B2W8W0_PYRTR|nr:uncharacterized protein PTRG_06418 [Pyrenophora tritici-repentis Pt-1C-BFP]EDU49338.1 predicted protein [Pyrenophora tritici-repentis Pt-1C-BFP]